jgi:hypothetical protein
MFLIFSVIVHISIRWRRGLIREIIDVIRELAYAGSCYLLFSFFKFSVGEAYNITNQRRLTAFITLFHLANILVSQLFGFQSVASRMYHSRASDFSTRINWR